LDDCIDVYNITNNYIKNNIKHDNIKEIINYIRLRNILKVELINMQ